MWYILKSFFPSPFGTFLTMTFWVHSLAALLQKLLVWEWRRDMWRPSQDGTDDHWSKQVWCLFSWAKSVAQCSPAQELFFPLCPVTCADWISYHLFYWWWLTLLHITDFRNNKTVILSLSIYIHVYLFADLLLRLISSGVCGPLFKPRFPRLNLGIWWVLQNELPIKQNKSSQLCLFSSDILAVLVVYRSFSACRYLVMRSSHASDCSALSHNNHQLVVLNYILRIKYMCTVRSISRNNLMSEKCLYFLKGIILWKTRF